MKFGISFGAPPESNSLDLVQTAEANGFDQMWAWDSHIIWNEVYSWVGWLIGNMQQKTNRLEWGTLITNPRTREPFVTASAFTTLANITDGRVICGIGRGDSFVRVMGRKPSTLSDLEDAARTIQTLSAGEELEISGETTQFATGDRVWASPSRRVPVYIAAYGPKALQLTGRVGDGAILQIADPFFIEWGLGHVYEGAKAAGRDPDDIVIHVSTANYISSDTGEAREQLRWFPALIGNHIADVLRTNDPGNIPADLPEYVHAVSTTTTGNTRNRARSTLPTCRTRLSTVSACMELRTRSSTKFAHWNNSALQSSIFYPHVNNFSGVMIDLWRCDHRQGQRISSPKKEPRLRSDKVAAR